jgi:peroxiredoxin
MSGLRKELAVLEALVDDGLAPKLRAIRQESIVEMLAVADAILPLEAGVKAPDFTLEASSGEDVRLSDLFASGCVLIHFYRGHWCPFCRRELQAYQKVQRRFNELGVTTVFLSPDAPQVSDQLQQALGTKLLFLSDPGALVASMYGVSVSLPPATREYYTHAGITLPECDGHKCWSLPTPATFVVSSNGEIVFSHHEIDYRTRLDPVDLVIRIKALLRGRKPPRTIDAKASHTYV